MTSFLQIAAKWKGDARLEEQNPCNKANCIPSTSAANPLLSAELKNSTSHSSATQTGVEEQPELNLVIGGFTDAARGKAHIEALKTDCFLRPKEPSFEVIDGSASLYEKNSKWVTNVIRKTVYSVKVAAFNLTKPSRNLSNQTNELNEFRKNFADLERSGTFTSDQSKFKITWSQEERQEVIDTMTSRVNAPFVSVYKNAEDHVKNENSDAQKILNRVKAFLKNPDALDGECKEIDDIAADCFRLAGIQRKDPKLCVNTLRSLWKTYNGMPSDIDQENALKNLKITVGQVNSSAVSHYNLSTSEKVLRWYSDLPKSTKLLGTGTVAAGVIGVGAVITSQLVNQGVKAATYTALMGGGVILAGTVTEFLRSYGRLLGDRSKFLFTNTLTVDEQDSIGIVGAKGAVKRGKTIVSFGITSLSHNMIDVKKLKEDLNRQPCETNITECAAAVGGLQFALKGIRDGLAPLNFGNVRGESRSKIVAELCQAADKIIKAVEELEEKQRVNFEDLVSDNLKWQEKSFRSASKAAGTDFIRRTSIENLKRGLLGGTVGAGGVALAYASKFLLSDFINPFSQHRGGLTSSHPGGVEKPTLTSPKTSVVPHPTTASKLPSKTPQIPHFSANPEHAGSFHKGSTNVPGMDAGKVHIPAPKRTISFDSATVDSTPSTNLQFKPTHRIWTGGAGKGISRWREISGGEQFVAFEKPVHPPYQMIGGKPQYIHIDNDKLLGFISEKGKKTVTVVRPTLNEEGHLGFQISREMVERFKGKDSIFEVGQRLKNGAIRVDATSEQRLE